MTEFAKRTTSPFRFDIVGSFLRPKELKEARAKYQAGQITKAELTSIEDKAIIDLIKKEEEAYKELPKVYNFGTADNREKLLQKNFKRIYDEVETVIEQYV